MFSWVAVFSATLRVVSVPASKEGGLFSLVVLVPGSDQAPVPSALVALTLSW